MSRLGNRVKQTTTATGDGLIIPLSSAVPGFQTFNGAGIPDGVEANYLIEDGLNWEYGIGELGTSGASLARINVLGSTNSGSRIALSGAAIVLSAVTAEDITSALRSDAAGNYTLSAQARATCALGTRVSLSGTSPEIVCAAGNDFTLITSGNTTISLNASGLALGATQTWHGTLEITGGGTHALAWAANVRFPNAGQSPDGPPSGTTDIYALRTIDAANFDAWLIAENLSV